MKTAKRLAKTYLVYQISMFLLGIYFGVTLGDYHWFVYAGLQLIGVALASDIILRFKQ